MSYCVSSDHNELNKAVLRIAWQRVTGLSISLLKENLKARGPLGITFALGAFRPCSLQLKSCMKTTELPLASELLSDYYLHLLLIVPK